MHYISLMIQDCCVFCIFMPCPNLCYWLKIICAFAFRLHCDWVGFWTNRNFRIYSVEERVWQDPPGNVRQERLPTYSPWAVPCHRPERSCSINRWVWSNITSHAFILLVQLVNIFNLYKMCRFREFYMMSMLWSVFLNVSWSSTTKLWWNSQLPFQIANLSA